MKRLNSLINKMRNNGNRRPADYIVVFIFIFAIVLALDVFIQQYNLILFQVALFLTGLFAWTFLEYMGHRYLMHSREKEKSKIDFNHRYHHTHPTEIKISGKQRGLLCITCMLLLMFTFWMNNYFTLVTGFIFGFPVYTLMHFLLHQKLTQKILRKHVAYHIYHHCKYPDKCFGITSTWWDDLFGSVPIKSGIISQRVIDFYFGNGHFTNVNLHVRNSTNSDH